MQIFVVIFEHFRSATTVWSDIFLDYNRSIVNGKGEFYYLQYCFCVRALSIIYNSRVTLHIERDIRFCNVSKIEFLWSSIHVTWEFVLSKCFDYKTTHNAACREIRRRKGKTRVGKTGRFVSACFSILDITCQREISQICEVRKPDRSRNWAITGWRLHFAIRS